MPKTVRVTNAQAFQQAIGRTTVQRHVLRVRASTDQDVPAGTFQLAVWDTLDYGPTGMFDVSNPTDIVIVQAGTYSFTPRWHDPGGIDNWDIVYQVVGSNGEASAFHSVHPRDQDQNAPFEYDFSSGDVIQVGFDNASGDVQTVDSRANSYPNLTVRLVSGQGVTAP